MKEERYSNVVRAFNETPWAILPDTYAAILEAVSLRVQGKTLSDEEIQARIGAGPTSRVGRTVGSVAVLPLYGTIFPRANLLQAFSGGTSLQQWAQAFDEAANNPRIESILIDVHSPGGSTFLVSETAQKIRAARREKPIVAIANALCCSAAYHLASQAGEIVAAPSSLIGSIGVFMAHEDWSKFEDIVGIKTTLISAGRYKTEGNQFEPLDSEARQALQTLVDEIYALFVSDVAAGRGTTNAKVKNGYGQGRVLSARQAVEEGVADRIDTFDATLDRMRAGKVTTGRAKAELPSPAAEDDPTPEPEPDVDPVDDQDDDDEPDQEEAAIAEALAGFSSDRQHERVERTLRAMTSRMEVSTK